MEEPGESAFFAQATVAGIVAAIGFSMWIGAIPPTGSDSESLVIKTSDLTLSTILFGIAAILGGFVALILTHESIHLLAHPKSGFSVTRSSISANTRSFLRVLRWRNDTQSFHPDGRRAVRLHFTNSGYRVYDYRAATGMARSIHTYERSFLRWRPCFIGYRPQTIAEELVSPASILGCILETNRTGRQRIWLDGRS